MTSLADDNTPYKLLVEQSSTPSNPAAGKQKIFIATSDHKLRRVNSSGAVTVIESTVDYSKGATMWHDQSLVVTGNAKRNSVNTSQPYGLYVDQNAAANGDVTENGFILRAGTYTFYAWIVKDSQGGKLDLNIDGGSVFGTIDFYNASTQFAQKVSIASVVVTGDGYHKLTMTINGSTSTGYHAYITKMWFEPASY